VEQKTQQHLLKIPRVVLLGLTEQKILQHLLKIPRIRLLGLTRIKINYG